MIFNIKRHKFQDPDIREAVEDMNDPGTLNLNLRMPIVGSWIDIGRDDAIALSRHFKLTEDDIK